MPTLYTYCIPSDEGSAPNPFWNVCTLNICKPVIRRNAKRGDWVVGTGSRQFGFENKVVYAMEVERSIPMHEYEIFCKAQLPNKIPDITNVDYRRRVGDCIYDFSQNPPSVLKSVHNIGNRPTDLRGENTLLATHFYYFGNEPEPLPDHLLSIVKQGQGHRSKSNAAKFDEFVDWILKQEKAKNKVASNPNTIFQPNDYEFCSMCSVNHKEQDLFDEQLGDE